MLSFFFLIKKIFLISPNTEENLPRVSFGNHCSKFLSSTVERVCLPVCLSMFLFKRANTRPWLGTCENANYTLTGIPASEGKGGSQD